MSKAVDPKLCDQQAGFRSNRSCANQIASLRFKLKQSLEWKSSFYVNFIDYEKTFDSVDIETLCKILRHYGVPEKVVSLIYFADDLSLLSHNHNKMQDKTARLETTSAGIGLKINLKNTELMKINTTALIPVIGKRKTGRPKNAGAVPPEQPRTMFVGGLLLMFLAERQA
eukprot:XP_019929802.1 PREDICTED: uncharacterized protein LOC109620909 [Crassostrea gigas]